MIFPSNIKGIPCLVEVVYFKPGRSAQLLGPPEDCYPSEPPEIEVEILDRKGYKAKWLEKKADPATWSRLEEEAFIMTEGETLCGL